jgi:acetyltransferase-like isoleucine patch superfamily enzyme
MPVDRQHAFALGPTESISAKRDKSWLGEWKRRFLRRLGGAMHRVEMEEVLTSFRKGAVAEKTVRLGPNAWCVNHGARESITLAANVICRGLLRLENFQPARLAIAEDVYIGDDTVISCAQHIEIGKLTMIAHGVQIFDNDSHPLDAAEREKDYLTLLGRLPGPRPPIGSAPVIIGERVWLGMHVNVMKGVRIGDDSVIAAGSVVTSDIAPRSIAAGVPAKVISAAGATQVTPP